jgi:hypothetical protein
MLLMLLPADAGCQFIMNTTAVGHAATPGARLRCVQAFSGH